MGWVDIVLDRRSAPDMFEIIAATETFEPDRARNPEFGDWAEVSPAGPIVRDLRARLRLYSSHLPDPDMSDTSATERTEPFSMLAENLNRRVSLWLEAAKPDLERLSEIEGQRQSLDHLRAAVRLLPPFVELGLWHSQSMEKRSYIPVLMYGHAVDVTEFLENINDSRLLAHFSPDMELAVVRGLMDASEVETLSRRCRQHGLQVLDVPQWIAGTPEECADSISTRIRTFDEEIGDIRGRLARVSKDHRMAGARWLIERQEWLEDVLEQSHQGRNFVHLGGWIPHDKYQQLVSSLKQAGKPFLIRLDGGDTHGTSPTILRNPSWAKNFEMFVNGFGTPDVDEVDPSAVLALVTPVMFGYMFGDVGQGMLLVVIGWILGHRLPWMRLLVPAGISAIAFGFLYGSVFSIEHWIPPLWIRPMDEPLLILGVPLLFGAGMMLLSLAFGYIEARWQAKSRGWLLENLPLLLSYLAPPSWLLSPTVALGLTVGSLLILLFAAAKRGGGILKCLAALPGALLQLLEHWIQLLINTLSFTRLGAFSLAHAGLSMALVSLSDLPESMVGAMLILVIGNLVVTALEGLVVSVQTTRLVMFEFFRRFFTGTGRRFRPMNLSGHPGAP